MLQTIETKGIYHGLPTYPPEIKGLTAIVAGVNGISGQYMMRVLAQNPERWTRIICLSRRVPAIVGGLPPHAEHISVDFLKEPQEISDILRKHNVQADHVFFYSYVHVTPSPGESLWTNAQELCDVNGRLLQNFLQAMTLASIKPKGFLLQTGGKTYGGHCGAIKIPMEEWDPRITAEPNFYHTQEDILWAYCKENNVNWNVTVPGAVLGAVPDSAMNICFPYSVYAAVCKHLNKSLDFPGDYVAYDLGVPQSSAMLNGYLAEWAQLTDSAKNERFNSIDDSAFSFATFWPRLAGWYGIPWKGPQEEGLTKVEWGMDPPPRGYGPRSSISYKFRLADWAKQPEVQNAWREIAAEHDLVYKEMDEIVPSFIFADWVVLRGDEIPISKVKGRKRGFHGTVDTSECMLEVFDELAKLKMTPEVPKVDVRFL